MTFFKTTYLCNALLDHLFGKTTYTPPSTLYFALYTVVPTKAGTDGTEVTIGHNAYARASLANSTASFNSAAAASKDNKATVTFATPTSTGWGSIVAVAIFDAATGGNMLEACILDTPKTIGAGVVVKFKGSTDTGTTGNLTITEA